MPRNPAWGPHWERENLESIVWLVGVRALGLSTHPHRSESPLSGLTLCSNHGRLCLVPSAQLPQIKRWRKQEAQLTTPLSPASALRSWHAEHVLTGTYGSEIWSCRPHVVSTLLLYISSHILWTASIQTHTLTQSSYNGRRTFAPKQIWHA
jgi:hypothetical protein